LVVANQTVPVAHLAPPGDSDPINWVYRNIYAAQRSGLMHAKQGRLYLLPQDAASRADLQASLDNLWRYVRELIAAHLGVTSGSSQMSQYGWAMVADPFLKALALFVTDDPSPFKGGGEEHEIRQDAATVELTPGDPAADADAPMLRAISASCDAADLRHLDGIRLCGAKVPGPELTVCAASELTGRLWLGESVTRVEIVHGMRSVSSNGAPRVFSS
jgi:hypothetical protein